jgi:hypothetical protein
MEPASQPLGRVEIDSYSLSITSIEGYKHSIIFTDSNKGLTWQYGMITKYNTLDIMSRRWYAEKNADIRGRYPLIMVVRDNSCEILNGLRVCYPRTTR